MYSNLMELYFYKNANILLAGKFFRYRLILTYAMQIHAVRVQLLRQDL